MSDTPNTNSGHFHKCMSCGARWYCPHPKPKCKASENALPSIVLPGPDGPTVFHHVCQRGSSPSDTPRTDAAEFYAGDLDGGQEAVPADFARQLERKLAAVTKERDSWRTAFENEKATSTSLEKLNEMITLRLRAARGE